MNHLKVVSLIALSIVIAFLLATALTSFTRVSDAALAEVATPGTNVGAGSSRPSVASTNYLPIIFLNSASAGGAWLLAGNAGTNSLTDFLGTTDNMTLTFRVSNTVAYRIVPAFDFLYGPAPNILGGSSANNIAAGQLGATIAGGGLNSYPNAISGNGDYSFVGGGLGNAISGVASVIGGGYANVSSNNDTTIGGGLSNTASGDTSTIGGGDHNLANGSGGTIGGGHHSTASGAGASVGGGSNNTASGLGGSVAGGYFNTANGDYGAVGGGRLNVASGYASVVAGGGGYYGIVPLPNLATERGATVGGGQGNTANGILATVPGGNQNSATGVASFAAGTFAHAIHEGTFVWGDVNYTSFSSTAANQFLVRASGGISLATSADLSTGCSIPSGGGGWNCTSNRNVKANFEQVDPGAILDRVSELPITTWNFKTQDASIRHLGPMAQDFAAAFHVGENDTTISTVDAQGVALAAIQGLAQENRKLKADYAAYRDSTDARIAALEQGQSPNGLSLNTLAPWAVVGLLAVWVRRKK